MSPLHRLQSLSRTTIVDACLVVVAAALLLILSPGLAIAALVALAVLAIVGISYAVEAIRRRRGHGYHR